jgi:hypothetical protein
VRVSKARIRARIKGDLPITFSQEQISAHGGLELLRRYLVGLDLASRIRQALGGVGLDTDYGVVRLLLCVIGLFVIGGWRISHLAFVGTDPMLLRFCGLHRMPADRTLARWLERFSSVALLRLGELIQELVFEQIERAKLARLTIDADGTVLRTGAHVERAERGFNPHHPKDPSYYPLTAHIAQLGQIVRVWNRPGNVNDSHGADGFLRGLVAELRRRFGCRIPIELRMDGAFFMPWVLAFLDEERLEWTIKVPLWQWLGIREQIAARRRWQRVSAEIDGFFTTLRLPQWQRTLRVAVYRKRVGHRTRKNFQLDLFSPDDGHFEYSAIATNKTLGLQALWQFAAGRGGHEKTLAELKDQLGFAVIPSHDFQANSAWQLLSVLTLNLVRSFQIATGAAHRPRTWKRTFDYVFRSLRTLRLELIHQPVRIVRPGGRPELRYAVAPAVRDRILAVEARLKRAA